MKSSGRLTFYKNVNKSILYFHSLIKPATTLSLSLFIVLNSYSQSTLVINSNAVNVHLKATAKSKVIGVVNIGDTVYLNQSDGSWFNIILKDGLQGYILKKYTTPVFVISHVSEKQQATIDMSSWSFSFLFSITFTYFLLITLILLFVFLIIHYFK